VSTIDITGSPVINGGEINLDFDWIGERAFEYILLAYNNQDGHQIGFMIGPNRMDEQGHVHVTQTLSPFKQSGTYELQLVFVEYQDGASDSWYDNDYNSKIVVSNDNHDVIPPELVPGSFIFTRTDNELIIDFDCLETGAGLVQAYFAFTNSSEYLSEVYAVENDGSMETTESGYRIRADISNWSPDTYSLSTLILTDAVMNNRTYVSEELPEFRFEIHAISQYSVQFDSQGGSDVQAQIVHEGGFISEPVSPSLNGFTFDGWFTDESLLISWDFAVDAVTADITLFAKWVENTQPGEAVAVSDPTESVTVLFDSVLSSGETTVVPLDEPVDDSYFYLDSVTDYFEINTTAQFEDTVRVSIQYDTEKLSVGQNEGDLRLYQFKNGIPVDITESVDQENNIIIGRVSHFCVFAVGIPEHNKVTIAYTGDTLKAVLNQSILKAEVVPVEQGAGLDLNNIWVKFEITDSNGQRLNLQARCDSSGSASIPVTRGTGVYAVDVRILENGYAAPANDNALVVIFDPNGGFVTGGGWIDSPAGAFTSDPNATGKANFGFVSKYLKGASTPTGITEFQFKLGSLNFKSDQYDWLVVNKSRSRAQFKRIGTVNGIGRYGFMIWAGDKGTSDDSFRIKIWNADNESDVIYDNGLDQAIGGGQINVLVK
jgi:uncharacterized repeat protein (TIGR02543 family)